MASAASDDGSLDALLAIETDRDGDVVGERMMSMDELKQEMFKSLKDTGTIEAIRAQLRRRFIEKLKQHGRKVTRDVDSGNNADADERVASWSVHEQLVHGLMHEYLQHHNMEHTMAVFVPEVGGPQQLLSRDAIMQMLRLPDRQLLVLDENQSPSSPVAPPVPLVTVLLKELVRRCSVATMSSSSQTAMDLADHRLALEHQLRRVETTYLAECATRKTTDQSAQSFEERVLRYQREYDELCDKRMQQDMERFQAQAVGLMRVEERKKFEREMDTLKTTMFQEHRDRLQRLHDRERDLEMDFAAKKAELEASLFEARQRVFQDIEKLRVRQQDAEAKYNAETRQLTMESKRLQLLEESLKVREENMQSAVDGMVREKERAWQLEKLQWQSDMSAREQQLIVREHDLEQGVKRVAKDKETLNDMAKTIATLESELLESQTALSTAERRAEKLAAEKKALLTETEARNQLVSEDKLSMKSLSYENARLVAELKASQAEHSKLEDVLAEKSSQVKQLEAELKGLQQELLTVKLTEANAVVDERKKFANALEAEREDARWKENELVGRLRELQSRLAESEATAEKYQTQYEDEKVHVETLRHEVSSLHALLAQSQSAMSTRHQGGSRGSSSSRNHIGGDSSRDNTDRVLMRMMEMMSQMAAIQGTGGPGSQQQATVLAAPAIHTTQVLDPPAAQTKGVEKSDEEEVVAKIKRDQERLERELLEQREFERKKRAREDEEQREMEQRRREFQEQLEQERLQRTKHDEELEQERRLRVAEQEARLHEELEKQRKALDEAREAQKKLLDDQIVAEQARLQQERAREEERARAAREEADLAAQRLQYLREQREEEEKEQERRQRQVIMEAEAGDLRATRREPTATIVSSIDADCAVGRTNEKQDETEFVADQSSVIEGESVRETQAEHEKQEFKEPEEVAVKEQQTTGDQSDEEGFHSEHDDRYQETEEPSRANYEEDHRSNHSPADNSTTRILEAEVHQIDAAAHVTEAEKIETALPPPTEKTEEELEEERRIAAEQAKKKEDEDALDVYRQRVLARRAAEKQRQQEIEEQKKREEEERAAATELARLQDEESEEEMEKSDGSFASSAASSSGSF